MPYTVIWTEKPLKNLKQLPRKIVLRIIASVERIRGDPLAHLQQLQGSPYFKLRVGKYHVTVDLKGETMIVYVIKAGKRGNVYNRI